MHLFRSRNRWSPLFAAAVAVGSLAAGCDVVDPDDIIESSELFYDRCDPDLDILTPSNNINRISFAGFTNDNSASASGCGLSGLGGNDGVFLFESALETNWRIVASAADEDVDLVLYVNEGCASDNCRVAQDRCGAGFQEEMTFFTAARGTAGTEGFTTQLFSLVVDSHEPYSGTVDLTLARPLCGNGEREPGEGCDDGNQLPFDGCSNLCLWELDFNDAATTLLNHNEPNDDPLFANEIRMSTDDVVTGRGGQVWTITGSAPPCDDDFFLLPTPDPSSTVKVSVESQEAVVVRLLSRLPGGIASPLRDVTGGKDAPAEISQLATDQGAPARYYVHLATAPGVAAGNNDYTLNISYEPIPVPE